MIVYLAEMTVYDPGLSATRVLRYATHGYTSHPSDMPSNVFYEPRIQQPALMRRDCFKSGTTGGASQVGYGVMILANADGALDDLIGYGMDGRELTIRMGDSEAALSSFAVVITGTMEQPEIGWDKVSIRIRDRQAVLDTPIQPTKYAGSNALPAGLEGVAGDLQAKPKPRTFGQVFNVPPPCVNTSRLIYQVNDGAVLSVDAVYDRANGLVGGANYASQDDMEANAPAAGYFRAWPAGGFFRLGSGSVGQVTADVTQGATAADRTVAQICVAIVTGPGAIPVGDVVSADVTALDTANSGVVGIWIDGEQTIKSALDSLCQSVGAWWGFDRLGQFRIQRLDAPSGSPVTTLTDVEIIRIERSGTSDVDRGIPAFRVNLNYRRFWQTQDSDISGVVSAARREEIKSAWRTVTSSDAAVKVAHLLAVELGRDGLLVSDSDAQAESDRLLALYGTRRDRLNVRVRLDETLADVIDLGTVVSVQLPRFGFDAGKLCRVLGIQPDLRTNSFDLTLWG